MTAMLEELYGQDILLTDEMQAAVAANGEVVVSTGLQTVLQDIKLRLFTPLGGLFYDQEFGSKVIEFVKDENTYMNRMALCVEVERTVGMDPRVVPGTVDCGIQSWDVEGVVLEVQFNLIDEQHPFNLIITITSEMEMVIQDVDYTG